MPIVVHSKATQRAAGHQRTPSRQKWTLDPGPDVAFPASSLLYTAVRWARELEELELGCGEIDGATPRPNGSVPSSQ